MIYLDANATTSLDPNVLSSMVDELSTPPSNPSSAHSYGQAARSRLQAARRTVASALQAKESEVIFTSGGTEGINLLLRSLPKGHIITSSIDHSALSKTAASLGSDVTSVPVSTWGAPTIESIEAAIRPDTVALVFTWANSETGVKIDVEALRALALKRSLPLILDAVGIAGREPISFLPGIAALAISAHKFHGPKGVGACLIRSSFRAKSHITGGPQERSIRAGTENLPGIVGMSRALDLFSSSSASIERFLRSLRDQFEEGLRDVAEMNGEGPRVPHVSNLYFPGVDGESLLIQLDRAGIAASHGSACASGALEPSQVLLNMGYSRERVRSSLRFSFHRFNTKEEVGRAIEILHSLIRQLSERASSSRL